MARVSVQLTNFTAGELSPRLDGRNDLSKYPSGCKTLENFIVYPHGSAARRSGTQFISEVKTSANKTSKKNSGLLMPSRSSGVTDMNTAAKLPIRTSSFM